jgi:mono/diheme cytochrome c family protein
MAGVAAVLAGCASTPGTQAEGPSTLAEDRGQAIADYRCGGCHATGVLGASPRAAAPPFRVLRVRFNGLTWERTMAEIAQGGHGEMPALALDSRDVKDLRAYIEGLR